MVLGATVSFSDFIGHPLITDTERILVPIRIISEGMGYDVEWLEEIWHKGIQKIWISDAKTKVEFNIGSTTALVNEKTVNIDEQNGNSVNTKAMLIGDRTYVPLRFVSEALGGIIEYEMKSGTHIIDIFTGKETIKPDIITPIFKIISHNKAGGRDFIIYVDNFKDYEGTNATFSPELISHPEYNFYKYENPWEPGKIEIADIVKTDANKKPCYAHPAFKVYSFGFNNDYFKSVNTGEPLRGPAEDTKMTVKITIKMNNQEKVFIVDIIRKGFTESYFVEGKEL